MLPVYSVVQYSSYLCCICTSSCEHIHRFDFDDHFPAGEGLLAGLSCASWWLMSVVLTVAGVSVHAGTERCGGASE